MNDFEDPLSNVLKQKLNVFFRGVNFLLKHKNGWVWYLRKNWMKQIEEFCFLENVHGLFSRVLLFDVGPIPVLVLRYEFGKAVDLIKLL